MKKFQIDVPQADLDDLHLRLSMTRFPDELDGSNWEYGMDLATLRRFVDYWKDEYDWRERERHYNQYDQFVTTAAGESVHFYHVRSPEKDAIPMVLLHGYMGSVAEFIDMIGPLSDPVAHGGDAADAFHVVVPSLPGHGWSGPTKHKGVDMHQCADAIADVMQQLGYDKYIVQGGDWGALITRRIGEAYADRLIALHFNMLFAYPAPGVEPDMSQVTPDEQKRMADAMTRIAGGTGYMSMLTTKPQTLAMAHNDSPAGMAAWLLEKYQQWCDLDDGDLLSVFSMDQLLDNIMFYWITGTTNSSGRLYYESTLTGSSSVDPWTGRIEVPTGHAVYPCELLQTPRAWAEKHYNIVYWSEQPKGGHFAPFEQPVGFTEDLREFARLFR
jgi:pimeloyl-ACP methyl ester carboxylesterase